MFHLLATTKCQRQQIAILIISFFAYVSGIRNEGNNMLLQQQLLEQQPTTMENSDGKSPIANIRQQSTLNFRPSQIIDFIPADAVIPQQLKPSYIETPHSTNNDLVIQNNSNNNNNNVNNNVQQNQGTQTSNRRYTIETAATYESAAEKPFSFPNEQKEIPQQLTDKPIYIYRDPFTNENYHHTPTEANVREIIYNHHNNYNNDAYKQQNLQHQHLQHYNDNQEYLVQSSMTVGAHQQQQHEQQEIHPFRTDMSLSADKDVYLKRPGFVYDEKPSSNHPNSVIEKKTKVNKISYDSHDYPPPSYFQQQTSNFLPTPVPSKPPTSASKVRPPTSSPYQNVRPLQSSYSSIYVQQQPQEQFSQSTLPNYANSIDNYLPNKQQTSEFYRTETSPPPFSQQQHYQYENKPSSLQYYSPQQSAPPSYEHKEQYFARPPPFDAAQISYPQYESARPPSGRPSYNNYYDYQIGEIPPQAQTSSPPSQHINYPYPRPLLQYPYQGPYRPPTPPTAQESGLASLAQYAPQFTSLLFGGVGGGAGNSNNNGPLGSLIGALTGAATSQQPSSSSSLSSAYLNRRPVNSQLIKALENIARNDDLQCVPKVLCQMIAAQIQRGQLPTFITSPAITNFLTGFPAASPALIYGRAALLGLSGGGKSCRQTYMKCPKDEYEIIDYLNNHRGGFFKFFSEPEATQHTINHQSSQQGATSLFSILSALTGAPQTTTTTPRPKPKPQETAADITTGIGNFFTQLLSDYVGGAVVEYQRRFKRRTKRFLDDKIKFEDKSAENQRDTLKFQDESKEKQRDVFKFKDHDFDENDEYEEGQKENEEDFHDEEDEEDTHYSVGFNNDEQDYLTSTKGRIMHTNLGKGKRILFFPEMRKENSEEIDSEEALEQKIKNYNDYNRKAKLRFPTSSDERTLTAASKDILRQAKLISDDANYGHQFTNYVEQSFDNYERQKRKIKFTDNHEDNDKQAEHLYSNYLTNSESEKTNIVFPKREGKILNHPYYAASFVQDYLEDLQKQQAEPEENEKFILPNDQRPLPYKELSASPFVGVYNTPIQSFNSQNSIPSNTVISNNFFIPSTPANTKSNHFLPTLPPQTNDLTNSNLVYSTKEYTSNPHKQNYYTKYLSGVSSSTSSFDNKDVHKPSQSNFNQYHSSLYTTRPPYAYVTTTEKSYNKNIYVTNSRGVTEYYITPDGRKVNL